MLSRNLFRSNVRSMSTLNHYDELRCKKIYESMNTQCHSPNEYAKLKEEYRSILDTNLCSNSCGKNHEKCKICIKNQELKIRESYNRNNKITDFDLQILKSRNEMYLELFGLGCITTTAMLAIFMFLK